MVLNLEDGSDGIVGRVEKMVVLLSWKPVLAPGPESFHSIIWPSLAALRASILLMIVVHVY